MKKENKKRLYLTLWVITGVLLAILIGGLIEMLYLYYDITNAPVIAIDSLLLISGILFGIWIGPKAWKRIYVDGARGKKYVTK